MRIHRVLVWVVAGWQCRGGLEARSPGIPEPRLPPRFDQIAGGGGNFVSEGERKFDAVGLRGGGAMRRRRERRRKRRWRKIVEKK